MFRTQLELTEEFQVQCGYAYINIFINNLNDGIENKLLTADSIKAAVT